MLKNALLSFFHIRSYRTYVTIKLSWFYNEIITQISWDQLCNNWLYICCYESKLCSVTTMSTVNNLHVWRNLNGTFTLWQSTLSNLRHSNILSLQDKSATIKSVVSVSKAKATMLRAEPTTTRTARISTSHSTRLTVLLVSRTQCYMWTKLWFEWQKCSQHSFCRWR